MHLRNATSYIRRHPILTALSVFSLSLAFLTALVFATSVYGSQIIIKYFESKAQISAYFLDKASQEEILLVKDELEQTDLVAEVMYVSKEEAKEFFVSENQHHPEILETLDSIESNPFPASLEIEASSIDNLPAIADTLAGNPLIEELSYREDVVNTLRSWTRGIWIVSLVLTGAFMSVAALVVLVTVGLTIFSKRDEIETMRLLGASKSFVRVPFLLQGGFYGFSAAFLSLIYLTILWFIAKRFLQAFLVGVPFPSPSYLAVLGLCLGWVVFGGLVGMLVSSLATLRYLRR